jgi:CRISPR-associated protein Csd1
VLSNLVKYARDHNLTAEPGFVPKTVKWALCFDQAGRYLNLLELGDTGSKGNRGREFSTCPDLQQSELVGGSEYRSHFLIETAQVIGLIFKNDDDEADNKEKIEAKRGYFVNLLRDAASAMPQLGYVSDSLEEAVAFDRIHNDLNKQAKLGDKVTISIGSAFPVESSDWHDWWRSFRASLGKPQNDDAVLMRCFITGELAKPLLTHPKVTGLKDVGGIKMGAGDTVICFDKEAFTSFGFDQSANCAISSTAASAYRSALNRLIENSGQPIAGARMLHWYNKPVPQEDNVLDWLKNPSAHKQEKQDEATAVESARKLLTSIRQGERPDLAGGLYYALSISGASGRVMVRDWMDGRFEDLVENIYQWFSDLQIVHLYGSRPAKDPGIERLITSLLLPEGREQEYLKWVRPVQPQARQLWRASLQKNAPIPYSALAKIVSLNSRFIQTGKHEDALDPKARDRANLISLIHARMALLKAYHIRKNGGTCAMTPYLNENHPGIAYQCGRLMAILRRIQWVALGNVGANVIQRFYGAASSTPAMVFPRLITLSNHHIAKISAKYGPGLGNWYTNRVADIYGKLKDAMPKTLNLEEQSLFALGYYQQIAFDNARKPETDAGLSERDIEIITDEEDSTDE